MQPANNLLWMQKNKKRIFGSKEEEQMFYQGKIKIDLLDKIGRIVHSHTDQDNNIKNTEKHAEVVGGKDLKQLDYDRRKTADHNNKKFEQKVMNIMLVDWNKAVAKVTASEIEDMGHLVYPYQSLEEAKLRYEMTPHEWDLLILNDVFGCESHKLNTSDNKSGYLKSMMNTLKILFGRFMKLNPEQKVIVLTLDNYRDIFKQLLEKHNSKHKIMLCKRSTNIKENEAVRDFLYKVS